MAGQIGIKTNLTIDSKNLKDQIDKLKLTLAKDNAFKINVAKESLTQLKELQALVKDITTMAGKGIKVKVDYNKVDKKPSDGGGSPTDDTEESDKALKSKLDKLRKHEAEKGTIIGESQKFIGKKLKEESITFKNASEEMEKITRKFAKGGKVTKITDIKTDYKAQEKAMADLRKAMATTEKSYKSLSKISGESMPDMSKLTDDMGKLDKNGFDVEIVQRMRDSILELGNAYKVAADKASGQSKALDTSKTMEKSAQAIEKMRTQYDQFKASYGNLDANNEVLNQLLLVESKMKEIQLSGEGTESHAFKNMELEATKLKGALDVLKTEVDLATSKETKINSLQKSLRNLFTFEQNGTISAQYIARIKDEIMAMDGIGDKVALDKEFNRINKSITETSATAKEATKSLQGMGNTSHGLKRLSDGLAKMGIYFSAWRLTSEIFQEIKRGIGVVSELDNQIVQVGIDMNITAKESSKLMKEAQRIAIETGIGIEEIVRVAGVYSNQTETMASVLAKVKPSAILAGVAGASATDITDMFQGVVNQYKLATDDIEGLSYQISDSIIGVAKNMSQNFDTSVKEISDVMLNAGASMEELGYSYQETMAMAGSIMEVTRDAGSTIGGALRMIGARIGGAKNTGEDVDIEEISRAAKAYKAVGIEIVDTQGNFKDMKTTLNELNVIWDDLTDVERSYIAEQSAGNRRRNTFMVLMDTMGKQTELTNIAMNSQGDTLKANEKYLESTGAKMQLFTNAMDTLWQNTLSSDGIKKILEIGTGFVKIADSIGVVNIAITAFSAYLIFSGKAGLLLEGLQNVFFNIALGAANAKTSVFAYGASIVWAGVKTLAFNAIVVATQALLTLGLSLAISTVVTWLSNLVSSFKSAEDRAKDFSDAIAETSSVIENAQKISKSITDKEAELANVEDAEAKLALEEEILNLRKQMAQIMPETATSFTDSGEQIAYDNELIEAQINLKKENMKVDAEGWLLQKGYSGDVISQRNAEAQALQDHLRYLKELRDAGEEVYQVTVEHNGMIENIDVNVFDDYVKTLGEAEDVNAENAEWTKNIAISQGLTNDEVGLMNITLGDVLSKQEELSSEVDNTTDKYRVVVREAKELDEAISEAASSMDELDGIMDEIDDKDFDGISGDSVQTIIEKYPHLLQYISDEKVLKEELLKLYDIEKQKSNDALSNKLLNLSTERKDSFNTMNAKIENDQEWYRINVLNNVELIKKYKDLYGIDLKNFSSMQQAKTESDRAYITVAASNYNSFFSKISNAYGEIAREADKLADKINSSRFSLNGRTIETDYDAGTGYKKQFSGISVATQGLNAISWSGANPSAGSGAGSSGSGSDKDKDSVYESDKAYFNKHTALIEEYQRQLEILENKISKTTESIAYYKEIGSDSAMATALVLQNRLYAEQTERLNLLNKAQRDIKNNQNDIASSMSSKGVDMSTQTAEDLNYWLDKLYPQISSTNQATVDAQNAKREAFEISWNSYMDYASELVSIESEIISMQGELLAILKEKYEIEFGIIEKRLSSFAKYTEDINRELALLDDSASYNTREKLVSESLSSLQTYKSELEEVLRTLKIQMDALDTGSAEWAILNDLVSEYEDTLHDTNVEIVQTQQNLKALRDEELNNSLSMLDKIAATVRKQYEEAKKAELDALKAAMDAEVKVKRAELQILQDRLDAMNDTTSDKEAELKALRDEAKMWENDNSVYAKRQLAELEKLIKEKEQDLEKDKIQDEMDNLEDEIDAIEEANQEKVDAVEKTYDELLADQNVYQQASLILMNSTQEEILALLLSYDERYKGMGSILGAAFALGLMEEIAKGLDSFDSLSDGLLGSDGIPWLSALPKGYTYDQSGGINANGLGTYSATGGLSNDVMVGEDGVPMDYASMKALYNYKDMQLAIENANVTMNVNFYTNGQLDTDKSIASLGDMLTGSLAGSGSMFNIKR